MQRLYTLCFCLLFAGVLQAKEDPQYPVSAIPDALKENVSVVFRRDELVFKILSRSRSSYSVHQVITILNANGKRYAETGVGYDKLSKISYFRGTVYDAAGKEIKRLKNSEIYDHSAFDGFSLYSDNRIKEADLAQAVYPYTVEFEYEIEFRTLFFVPDWQVSGPKYSVQYSRYELVYPKDLKPRISATNIDTKPVVTSPSDNVESSVWEFKNVLP